MYCTKDLKNKSSNPKRCSTFLVKYDLRLRPEGPIHEVTFSQNSSSFLLQGYSRFLIL